MKKISSPIPILEFGSTYIRLAVYEKNILNQNLYYEKKLILTEIILMRSQFLNL